MEQNPGGTDPMTEEVLEIFEIEIFSKENRRMVGFILIKDVDLDNIIPLFPEINIEKFHMSQEITEENTDFIKPYVKVDFSKYTYSVGVAAITKGSDLIEWWKSGIRPDDLKV
jgi:hypothetical protein